MIITSQNNGNEQQQPKLHLDENILALHSNIVTTIFQELEL